MKITQRIAKLETISRTRAMSAHIVFVPLGEDPAQVMLAPRGMPTIIFTGCPVGTNPARPLEATTP
jgi:hypothetical protein